MSPASFMLALRCSPVMSWSAKWRPRVKPPWPLKKSFCAPSLARRPV